jgi:hypothetical protein
MPRLMQVRSRGTPFTSRFPAGHSLSGPRSRMAPSLPDSKPLAAQGPAVGTRTALRNPHHRPVNAEGNSLRGPDQTVGVRARSGRAQFRLLAQESPASRSWAGLPATLSVRAQLAAFLIFLIEERTHRISIHLRGAEPPPCTPHSGQPRSATTASNQASGSRLSAISSGTPARWLLFQYTSPPSGCVQFPGDPCQGKRLSCQLPSLNFVMGAPQSTHLNQPISCRR